MYGKHYSGEEEVETVTKNGHTGERNDEKGEMIKR